MADRQIRETLQTSVIPAETDSQSGSAEAASAGEQVAAVSAMKRLVAKYKLSRMWTIIAAAATFLASVVSIAPIVFSDASNANSLAVSMKPFRSGSVIHFALPEDAPIGSLPPGGPLCTPAQEAWLDTHGVRFQRDYLVELRNTASSGSSLAVSNFRGTGKAKETGKPAYVVECDKTGDGGAVLEPARLLLDSGEGAFFDKSVLGAAGAGQPNSPLAYNLRPGETGQIVLTLSAITAFEGDIVVNVAAGSETADVTVTPETVSMPALISPRTVLISVTDGALKCRVMPNPSALIESCDAQELFTGQ